MKNKIILISKQLNYSYRDIRIEAHDFGNHYKAHFIVKGILYAVNENTLPPLKFRIRIIIDKVLV